MRSATMTFFALVVALLATSQALGSNVAVHGLLTTPAIAVDPSATWLQAATAPCQTLRGPAIISTACMKYGADGDNQGGTYLGWYATKGGVGTSAEAEMTPGSGPVVDWSVDTILPANAMNGFESEFDLNDFAGNDTTPKHRSAIVIRGRGVLSNAAVKITGEATGWAQWVTGLLGVAQVYGPTLADTSSSKNAYHFASGSHQNMIVANNGAAFVSGVVKAQSDAPAASNENVVWQPSTSTGSAGLWEIGPRRSDKAACGICVTTPGSTAAIAMVSFANGVVRPAGSIGLVSSPIGSVHKVVFGGHGISVIGLKALFTDAQDLSGPGTATLDGRLACADTAGNNALWSATIMWSLASGKIIGQSVSLRSTAGSATGLAAPIFWRPVVGPAAADSFPAMSVQPLASSRTVSCKLDGEIISLHA